MPGRRLIVLLFLLLISLSVLSASRDISRTRLPGSTTPGTTPQATTGRTTTKPAEPSRKVEPPRKADDRQPVVKARLPATSPVDVSLGTRVQLSVKGSTPEILAIDELGVRSPAGAGTRATLDFVASAPGRFPVTLAISGQRVGEVRVKR